MRDEELAAVGARTRVGHGQDAGDVVFEVGRAFVGKLVARTTGAGALGAAALDHEIIDHAVENEIVVITPAGEIDEIGYGQWGLIGKQSQIDNALVGFDDGFQIGHGTLLGWKGYPEQTTGRK